ncbi:uncharacterized protein LOC142775878 [Rhipicephalus microplus]|uniref:uncharacterized protein LOC142775878 n=1 Tax=Rhipicephalus microplus TaxID=6941 RepID=UPI003F6A8D46
MQPVATPLTYADAVQRLPQPPDTTRPQPARPAAYTAPWAAPPVANPWRTSDNRLICYACFTLGHVARYGHRSTWLTKLKNGTMKELCVELRPVDQQELRNFPPKYK